MIKHLHIEQGSEAWFDLRLGRVTGTSFKDLMAAKTTAAYQNLVFDIAAEKISGKSDDSESYENEWMQRGKELEPIAAEEYSRIFDVEVTEVGFVVPDIDSRFHEWIGVSPDRLLPDNGILEIKCPKRSTHWNYLLTGKLPSEYRWQVMGQLFVTGADYCDFMSYYPDLKPFIIRVYPDAEMFAKIESELDILIESVLKQIEFYKEYDFLQ